MCFSAIASFTTAALLLPLGIYASNLAWRKDSRYLSLTIVPIFFGIQQGIEGMEWLSIKSAQTDMIRLFALGFLFFAYGFWLVGPALAMWIIERRPKIKRRLLTIALIGLLFGASLYLPLWIYPDRLSVVILNASIVYQTQLIYDRFLSRDMVHVIYLAIVLCPLYLSNLDRVRFFAGLIALSMIASSYFFNYAFVSIWCFWAALLSLYIVYIVKMLPSPALPTKL
jgi:hypothetical protein